MSGRGGEIGTPSSPQGCSCVSPSLSIPWLPLFSGSTLLHVKSRHKFINIIIISRVVIIFRTAHCAWSRKPVDDLRCNAQCKRARSQATAKPSICLPILLVTFHPASSASLNPSSHLLVSFWHSSSASTLMLLPLHSHELHRRSSVLLASACTNHILE